MKKRIIKHITDIATSSSNHCCQYTDGDSYYVIDGHRVISYGSVVDANPEISINAHAVSVTSNIKQYFFAEHDCVMYQLPPVDEIKDNISKIAGRAYSTKVIYGNEKFAINARYLLKAMEALNATVCYIDAVNPGKCSIFLHENDDQNSLVTEIILPIIRKNPNQIGYWKS